MNLTVSDTNFTAGQTKQITITIEDVSTAWFGTETSGISFSLDGNVWQREINGLRSGSYTIYVRVASTVQSGVIADGLQWTLYSTDSSQNGSADITISGGIEYQYETINFSLSARTATVQYNGTLVNSPARVGQAMTGTVLDHHFQYEIERLAEQGNKSAVSGASFARKLVETMILYKVTYRWDWAWLGYRRPSFTDHVTAISNAIGIPIVYHGMNWYPKTDLNITLRKGLSIDFDEQLSGTFGSILDNLIGFSNDVPNLAINLYIENGTIYLIQRGYEANNRTPEAWEMTPTITHTIRHTQWADSQYQDVLPKEISSSDNANSNEPYSGTITWGTASLTYVDGYLTSETNGDSTTTYTYTDIGDGKLLQQKVTEVTDQDLQEVVRTATTTYEYQSTGTEQYLYKETYTVVEDGVTIENKVTTHVPIGGGWYGTTIYDAVNDEEVSTSLSQGAPGNKASQYMTNKANDALKPATGSGSQRKMVVPLTGVAKARQSYPVADIDMLRSISQGLDRYEGKEEITLQGEIVGGSHIYTFDDTITYKGNTYYLVSNNVSVAYNKIRQSITAVRWVLL